MEYVFLSYAVEVKNVYLRKGMEAVQHWKCVWWKLVNFLALLTRQDPRPKQAAPDFRIPGHGEQSLPK